MINFNKISQTTKDDFAKWYSKITITRPTLAQFFTLSFEFTIGIYIAYIQSKNYLLIPSTLGYKLRKYPVNLTDGANTEFLLNVLYEAEISPIESYKVAIQATLEYIDNPF